MKKVKISEVLLLLILVVAFVPGTIIYQQLPARVPTHWDIHGQINGYGSRFTGVYLVPLMNLGFYFLFKYLPKIDPKGKNYFYFSSSYIVLRWAIHIFLTGIHFIVLWSVYQGVRGGTTVDPSLFIVAGVCLLFMVIGNYMGRIRHNYFVGIRNPWTLASEEVWTKTHRLGAKVWVASGAIGLLGLVFNSSIRFVFLLAPVFAGTIFITIYSYWIYRKLHLKQD